MARIPSSARTPRIATTSAVAEASTTKTVVARGRVIAGAVTSIAAFAGLFLCGAAAVAQPRSTPAEGDFLVRDFELASGERLAELKLHYRTLGTLQRNGNGRATNAVLILHGTGGTGGQFLSPAFAGGLFGPGQLLDERTHYIILPDNLGHGASSKPSDGLRAKFPKYGYTDLVRLQHRLVTEHLKVDHLRIVMGTSMGGMHTWMWGYMYPLMMDGLVPLASVPTQIAGRNRMMRKMISDSIRLDPGWQNGDYTSQPVLGLRGALNILLWMTSSPKQWQKEAPTRDAADAFYAEQIKRRLAATDANDMLYQFESSSDYDPSPHLAKITAPLLAINSADDQVNPPELRLMEELMPRVTRGKYVLLPITDQTRGHGTHSMPSVWGEHLRQFLSSLVSLGPTPRVDALRQTLGER
jgi:homoserine O-acetyltransferase